MPSAYRLAHGGDGPFHQIVCCFFRVTHSDDDAPEVVVFSTTAKLFFPVLFFSFIHLILELSTRGYIWKSRSSRKSRPRGGHNPCLVLRPRRETGCLDRCQTRLTKHDVVRGVPATRLNDKLCLTTIAETQI